jgi:hypothetical protein
VQGASIHISGNKAEEGLGVEFLEYLNPKNGKPYPKEERADDLIHYETIMVTNQLDALYEKLKSKKIEFVSIGIAKISENNYLYKRGFYVRDPDGHVVGLFEK